MSSFRTTSVAAGASTTALAGVATSSGVGLGEIASKAWAHRTELNAAGFFLRNPTKPWLLPFSVETINHANSTTGSAFSKLGLDDGSDAFRHAYTAAQFVQRLTTERGIGRDAAMRLTRAAGIAHEDDTRGEWLPARREMDTHNNEVGMTFAPVDAPGRAAADTLLRQRVLDALGGGELQVFDEHYSLRESGPEDMPGAPPIVRVDPASTPAGS